MGVLGTAWITPFSLLSPAAKVPEVSVVAVASRNPAQAQAYAHKHRIPQVIASYDELIARPDIDAVYIPLPNSLHCHWTIKALEAGKHVLCEKPLASNTQEAQQMALIAEQSGRVLMEAVHTRYHPLMTRMMEIVASGDLGKIQHIEISMCFPILDFRNIRYRYDLAGGTTMDEDTIHLLLLLGGANPEVTKVRARLASAQVDRWMTADFRFANGGSARMTCALFSAAILKLAVRVRGELGEMNVLNPFFPHIYHRLKVRTAQGKLLERVAGQSTYFYQLRAFADSVLRDAPLLLPPTASIQAMQVIDAIYKKAGLRMRGERMM
jgi:predicted dehydrogenase